MNKLKVGSLIFMISITGMGTYVNAERKESNDLYSENIVEKLTLDSVQLNRIRNKYPEINITQLVNKQPTSEAEEEIIERIVGFIDSNSFENVINTFSSSLFEDVPTNDAFEGQKYEITDLENVYTSKIQKDSRNYAKLMVNVNDFQEYDQETVKKQIILLSYLIRWGSFSDGNRMFWNELYSNESSFLDSNQVKALNASFINLFSEDPSKYLASKNVTDTFNIAFKSIGLDYTFKKAVERFLIQVGITDYSQWFYDSFKGRTYKDHYEGTSYDVGIWNRSNSFSNYLPYLLNQSDNSNLMIGETRGEIVFLSSYNYQNDFNIAEKVLRKAMKTITNTLELYDHTIEDKNKINVDQTVSQRTIFDQGRNWLNPDDSLSYELYRVAGRTVSHVNNGGIGGAGEVQMQAAKLEENDIMAHEFAHELNDLFNADGEFYTSYVCEYNRYNGAYLNTFSDGETVPLVENSVSNTTTSQMQTKEDMMNYVNNMEDMAYVLDGIVATKVLELPVEEQAKYIKIALVEGVSGAPYTLMENFKTNQVKDLTVEELKKLNIKTIDDLIDNNAVIMQPNDTNGNIFGHRGQGLGTTLTYSPFFLINGRTTTYNHRIINTLLAEDGWEGFKTFNLATKEAYEDGLVDPNLNIDEGAGVASLYALRKVYNDENLTYRDLVRKRYTESMNNFKERGLLGDSYETVLNELTIAELPEFYRYKENMMKRYLYRTNDFSTSVFEDNGVNSYNVNSYTELYETVEKNPSAIINVIQDFKVEGKYAEKPIPMFSGVLLGNGHTISGATHSLFTKIKDAEVKNLLLDKVDIMNTSESTIGGLAGDAENSKINNVHVTNSKVLSSSNKRASAGGLVGKSTMDCIVLNSTVQDTEVSGSYVGGIIGESNATRLLNVYSTGEVKNSASGDLRIGGIIGNGFHFTRVKNSYSTMKVTKGNGMLGSDYTDGLQHISFENSISLATITNNDKHKYYNYGVSLLPWKNNFEIEEYAGKTSTTLENLDVTSVSVDQLNQAFFAKQLTWENESIWGIEEDASETKLPYLKNLDPRNKEEKDLSTLTLKTERKEIYVGEELDLTDLIEEVRDKEGQIVDKKEVSITGTVDNSQPGETVIVYKYNNIEKKVTVVVKEKQTTINVHDSTLYVGDTWQAKDNFDGATDKEGKEVAFDKITVGGDTVDTSKAGRYEVVYSYDGVDSKAVVTVKEAQSTAFEKETKITFLEDNETGTIIDPDNPGEGVTPVDPSNPHGAELMISYASDLNFGVQSKMSTRFNALADQVWVDESTNSKREVTPFVATKDSRGASREGWRLTVTQDDVFKDKNKEVLKGAEISLSGLVYPELEGAPKPATLGKIVLNNDAQDVAKAGVDQGIGSWTLALGSLEGERDQVGNKTTSGVTLTVPSTTSKNTGSYMTTVTWELATDPTL